jgi:hypothetical protein
LPKWGSPRDSVDLLQKINIARSSPPLATLVGGMNHRAGNEQLFGHAGMRRRLDSSLGQRHVSCRRHKFPELRIGHLVTIDPEFIEAHNMSEPLLRPVALRAHDERSAADALDEVTVAAISAVSQSSTGALRIKMHNKLAALVVQAIF